MVNKTLLPPAPPRQKRANPCKLYVFLVGTGFAEMSVNRGLGELGGSLDPRPAWEGRMRVCHRGELPMENMLLVGLSRQMTLERQVDVVANNIANINTNGFKADRSLFEEYLRSNAHEDTFSVADRRVSFVQDRGTYRDFSQGPTEQTKNPLDVAIAGNAFLVVQTAAGERYTRDGGLQINPQGQLVTASGDAVLGTGGPIVFQSTDHDITIGGDGGISVREGANRVDSLRGKLRLVSFTQAQSLLKEGSNLYSAGEGAAPQPAVNARVQQGYIEKSNVNSVVEMSHMIEVNRAYTQMATLLQTQSDLHKSAIEKLADVPS
jgi:flagellar basal-body rod protein FlgF